MKLPPLWRLPVLDWYANRWMGISCRNYCRIVITDKVVQYSNWGALVFLHRMGLPSVPQSSQSTKMEKFTAGIVLMMMMAIRWKWVFQCLKFYYRNELSNIAQRLIVLYKKAPDAYADLGSLLTILWTLGCHHRFGEWGKDPTNSNLGIHQMWMDL